MWGRGLDLRLCLRLRLRLDLRLRLRRGLRLDLRLRLRRGLRRRGRAPSEAKVLDDVLVPLVLLEGLGAYSAKE